MSFLLLTEPRRMPALPRPIPGPIAPASADQRDAVRTPLRALRPAKLVVPDGEYLCLLRDVSAGGVKLGLFHPAPIDTHAFLELANGEVFPVLRVRHGVKQASYRFATPIDPGQILRAPAQHAERPLRVRAGHAGLGYADGRLFHLTLTDMAQGGACLDTLAHLALGQRVVLSMEQLPEISGWIRWRKGRRCALVFDMPLRIDELAQYALALHPLAREDAAVTPARVA